MKAVVLTYHSHHVVGAEYHNNDHVALPIDLALIAAHGYRIVPLCTIVSAVETHQALHASLPSTDFRYVGITFDDGPIFDVDDFVHPIFGLQRSFLNILRDFADTPPGQSQVDLNATSFVIASQDARRVIEETFDAEYTYLAPGSMRDDWWPRAIASGLISIANHSWDHLHPALPSVAHSRQARADFSQVTTEEDANSQILQAAKYIATKTDGKAAPFFAYPFGHYNAFLTQHYMPATSALPCKGVRAAFTADPHPITGDESVWSLPRYVCGHHWKSSDQLLAILGDENTQEGG